MKSFFLLLVLGVLHNLDHLHAASTTAEADALFSAEQDTRREALRKISRDEANLLGPLLIAERSEILIIRKDSKRSAASKDLAIREIRKKYWLKRRSVHEAAAKEREAVLLELRQK